MITLSNEKIESLLSLTGNNKCIECEKNSVEWVSFPTTIFLCSSCCRLHKGFNKKETLKSVEISEFTEEEVTKMNLGGNARYCSLLNEYKISLTEPNIESKYKTVMTSYYNALLDAETNKIRQAPGAEEIYSKIVNQKPSIELGVKFVDENTDYFSEVKQSSGNEFTQNINNNNDSTGGGLFGFGGLGGVGGFFNYLGNQLSNAAEQMGINKAVNDAKTGIDSALTNYGIKDTVNKTFDYAKVAGNYIVDKGKEIAETPMMQGVVSKVSEGVNIVKESATNMISTIATNIQPQQNPNQENVNNNMGNSDNSNQNVYQQLNKDQL